MNEQVRAGLEQRSDAVAIGARQQPCTPLILNTVIPFVVPVSNSWGARYPRFAQLPLAVIVGTPVVALRPVITSPPGPM
jgi:hypothetical protein